jgi:hypothetical protein
MSRIASQTQALHFSYEKAGLVLNDQPIPWNAEAVLVEANLRLPPSASRRKADFVLRVPGQPPLPPENLRRVENEDRFRISFRLPPPCTATTAELLHRNRLLGQLELPFLSREDFLQGLRLQMPTMYARLDGECVACQTFVTHQCKGLLASALVTSPTSLVPLLDLELQVEFRSETDGSVSRVPVRLCSSQLSGRQALLTVALRKAPRRQGAWSAVWLIANRPLVSQRIRGISTRQFLRSLRVSDTRFVVQRGGEPLHLMRQPPPLETVNRVGPCFLVSSSEPGMAGVCPMQITAQVAGAVQSPQLFEQQVLISDGPTMVVPGTLERAELRQVSAFELRIQGKVVGLLSLCPAPSANFTAEGGFKPAQEFPWTNAAEDEMNERLNRLLEG